MKSHMSTTNLKTMHTAYLDFRGHSNIHRHSYWGALHLPGK